MTNPTQESDASFEPPEASDGFHEPSANTKRRNLLTAGIILAVLLIWVAIGLRNAFF